MPAATSRTALRFRLGGDICHVDIKRVDRVLPWAHLDPPMPGAPEPLVGWLNYHEELIPVIDLGQWVTQQPVPAVYSSRIMVLKAKRTGGRRIGLLVESLTDTNESRNETSGRMFDPDQVLVALLPLLPNVT